MAPIRRNSSHGRDQDQSTPPASQPSANDDVVPTIELDQQGAREHHRRLMHEAEVLQIVNSLCETVRIHLGQCETEFQIQTCRLGQLRIEYKRTSLECLLLHGLPRDPENIGLIQSVDSVREWTLNSWDVVVDYVSDVTGHRVALIECIDRYDAAMALLYAAAGNPAPRSYTSDLLISMRHIVGIYFSKCMNAIEELEMEVEDITNSYRELRPYIDEAALFFC